MTLYVDTHFREWYYSNIHYMKGVKNMELNVTKEEMKMITTAQSLIGEEYSLIRITKTMLKKSIIDAVGLTRHILKSNGLIDYSSMKQGESGKQYLKAIFLVEDKETLKVSCYRPKTKQGDPRIWFYGLKSWVGVGQLLMLTVKDEQLYLIPIDSEMFSKKTIRAEFENSNLVLNELLGLVKPIIKGKPILSCSPYSMNPKDVGDTFEAALGISANNSKLADFKDTIEIKTKQSNSNTKDTLFSQVPNWEISNTISAKDMILTYGYPSKKEKYACEDFIDLYVTVSNKPNQQGLFLKVDESRELIIQYAINDNRIIETAVWKFEDVEKRLYSKHPETLWVEANIEIIDGKFYFDYYDYSYTRKPVFSSFLLLIEQGIITYDWRGRVKSDGTKYKDKGHCFRLNPKKRDLLFSEVQ